MTHSKVFADQDGWFVTLAVHPEDERVEDWLISVDDVSGETYRHYGLFEYALDSNDGMFYIYDPIEGEMYEPTTELWEGVDSDAVGSLYNAVNLGIFEPIGPDYRAIQNRYLDDPDDPLGALEGGYPVGTVVRIKYGENDFSDPDVLVKRSNNRWEAAGMVITWSETEVMEEDYEVIWNA